MSFRFWPDDDTSIDLGSPFVVLAAFKEMAHVSAREWPSLYGVVHADDQDLSPEYVAEVRTEAADYLERHGDELGDNAKKILELLS